jgi:hypothetical protein
VEHLGVADLAQGLAEARQLWQDWVEQDPRLASAPAVDVLQDWLMLVGIDAADEVLHALVKIGSPSGRDCRPAAWVVAWALLPGATAVARRAPARPETDALVASQLWLEPHREPPAERRPAPHRAHPSPLASASQRDDRTAQKRWEQRTRGTPRTQAPPLRCRLSSPAPRPNRRPNPRRLTEEQATPTVRPRPLPLHDRQRSRPPWPWPPPDPG